ncbi:MAG: 4-hydroxythreonine-4-phosphate dehydrogenase PdxA, partial [Clostridia bacterium]|nr:4-hydroxythreonine-4-phosphate dehydrogenase PdxA [Clostridia bacterium]
MKTLERPVIGITMGDPAGIGPEIIVKALKNEELYNQCKPLVIGDIRVLEFMSGILNLNSSFHVVDNPDNGRYTAGTINVLSLDNVDTKALRMGEIQPQAGKAAYEYIKEASRLCMLGDIQAVATAPIHKESIKAAGIEAIGHTEMFGELTGTEDPLTLFEVYGLRIFFLTRHLSLKDACTQVKMDRIVAYLERCHIALSRLGLARRKMAVAGLNPHSGEHG